MGVREEKKHRLRSQLYQTAIELFRERGFDQTRVQDVVERVGVSDPTFFNHFPTKEAVLEEFAVHALDGFIVLLRDEVDDTSRPITEKVRSLLASVAELFSSDRDFMAVVATRSSLFLGARGEVLERELGMYSLVTELLRRTQRRGELRRELDPSRLAETFTGAYMLAVMNWLIGWWGERGDLGSRLEELGDVLLSGCLAEPRRSRRARDGA
jgi:AcrR family transcriptional regulator